jgi:hypothetical protein
MAEAFIALQTFQTTRLEGTGFTENDDAVGFGAV